MKTTARHTCQVKGCTKPAALVQNKPDGTPVYRRRADTGWVCGFHHNKFTAAVHGLRNIAEVVAKKAGHNSVYEYLDDRAKKAGYSGITEKLNESHPYRKHRLTHCENRDGRLGYKCRCTIRISAQLQVDHIDGDPTNNDPKNLQTLCANCHIYKTHANKDYATPGRKALKLVKPE